MAQKNEAASEIQKNVGKIMFVPPNEAIQRDANIIVACYPA